MTKKKGGGMVWALVLGGGCLGCLVCGGIGAAIGIPSFLKYEREAKAVEASVQLGSLSYLVQGYCEDRSTLPGQAGPVPPAPTAEKQIGMFDADPVFREIGFGPLDPVYYSYEIRPAGPGQVTLFARGDLDGDGVYSEHTWQCLAATCTCTQDYVDESNRLE